MVKVKSVSSDQIESLFRRSALLLQQGDAAGAKKGLLKVAKRLPTSAVVWYNLGLSHQHLAEHRDAIAAFRKAARLKRDFADAWINLGLSYKETGRSEEAADAARTALGLDGRHPRALNLLGTLAAERGDHDEARVCFEQALSASPDYPHARFNLANLQVDAGDDKTALAVLEPLLAGDPDNKAYRLLQAQILMREKHFVEAGAVVGKLRIAFPDDDEVQRLGVAYREVIRDHFGVIDDARPLLERLPDDAGLWNSLGCAYFQLDGIENAKAAFENAIRIEPDHAEYENNLGLAFSSLGDKAGAERHYRRSLELNPQHAEAYRNIATMKRFTDPGDPDAVAVKALWERDDLDDFTRIKTAFALGKIYDDCAMYDEAFDVYRVGNALKFQESKMSLGQYFEHMDRFVQFFDRPPDNVARVETDPQPIFVLGMPRSGTTLIEQILSRHPQVTGCGELPCIERAILRMEQKSTPQRVYPNDFWTVPAETFAAEATEYASWVHRLHDDIDTPYITDKMPFNFVHLWLIRAMFPGAAIVHCRRHPLDVILSNFFQLYGSDVSFVYDLDALCAYYVRYYRLMEHWQRLLGDAITDIQYETLIHDAEVETRRLVDAVGLHWDDACLDAKRSGTAVRTASIWQVRQGIYTRSEARWRHYEKQLEPVRRVLESEGIPL